MTIKSRFPGFDPYLENHWGDVHHSFIQYTRDALQEGLPDDLISRVGERVYVESDDVRLRSIVPDAHIAEWQPSGGGGTAVVEGTDVALAESLVYSIESDPITEGFIEIREADGGRIVTVIEYLSPTNKAGGEGTAKYRQKQSEILASETSLVEIDLVKSGRRVLALAESRIPEEWRNDSLALVRRGWKRPYVQLFRLPLRQALKPIPVPLRKHEKPLLLDLQAIHDECFRKGRYDRLNYAHEPAPPLVEADLAWAKSIVAASNP